jgi:hypothetical protein
VLGLAERSTCCQLPLFTDDEQLRLRSLSTGCATCDQLDRHVAPGDFHRDRVLHEARGGVLTSSGNVAENSGFHRFAGRA